MRGLITARHVVAHGPLLVRHFGLQAYLRCIGRCLRHPSSATFLEAMCRNLGVDNTKHPLPTHRSCAWGEPPEGAYNPRQQNVVGSRGSTAPVPSPPDA